MIDYAEKRDFLRMPIDAELSFSKAGDSDLYEGHVINLSSKGILFTSSEKFDEGTALEILLTPSNSGTSPIEASAVVSRITYNDVVYEIACKIIDIK